MTRILIALCPLVLGAALASPATAQTTPAPQAIMAQAVADFEAGRIAEANAGFDTLARVLPDLAPQLWQRGIALYYAGRYQDCREQFESHLTVNPADVENAAWHFLCVARDESPAAARKALLPVGPDSRRVLPEIYEMFRGKLTPYQVRAVAGDDQVARFYADLYIGLYMEASGEQDRAIEYLTRARDNQEASSLYMHMVTRVHLALFERDR